MKKILLLMLFCLFFVGTSNVSAKTFDYEIQKYLIEIDVSKENVYFIKETINVNFNQPRHGIIRDINFYNKQKYADGSTATTRAKITNIKVNDKYDVSTSRGYKSIRIGDEDKYLTGKAQYVISYNYDLGKDVNPSLDEFYFNVIGTQWDCNILETEFIIKFPSQISESSIGVMSGNNNQITHEISDNILKGKTTSLLSPSQPITVRVEFEEGYFTATKVLYNSESIAAYIAFGIFIIIALFLWFKFGKDRMVIETVEFYPPWELDSAMLAYYYRGILTNENITSLVVFLASKGYLSIIDEDKKITLHKEKEYDGNVVYIEEFFNGLFCEKDEVSLSELENKFYVTINKVSILIHKEAKKVFEKNFLAFIIVILMLIVSISMVVLSFLYVLNTVMIFAIITSACLVGFLIVMPKRTKFGAEALGRIRGFKRFITYAKKEELEKLALENPSYYYDILPYAQCLGVTDVWMNKLNGLNLTPPNWYRSSTLDFIYFSHFMSRSLPSISTKMVSMPASKSSSGSSFGGGSFGGGAGGGGGRSW